MGKSLNDLGHTVFNLSVFEEKKHQLPKPGIQNPQIQRINIFLTIFQISFTGRVARALPPRYLEVEGFKDCLIDMVKPGGQANIEYCFPLSQPAGCPNKVWQEMGEAYKGKSNK